MAKKVTRKQHNSRMCFVCGLNNPAGLQASFYEIEGDSLVAVFTPQEQHQSYPGRMHGGIAATILDETIGRAIMIGNEDQVWGVTLDFSVSYKKPVPLGVALKVVGRITEDGKRIFSGTGEILLPDGEVAVTARGKYMKVPLDRIAESGLSELDWEVTAEEGDPVEITI
ncbi:MAG: PaaI family thioesterase [Geobacter sp.]|nr:PaaI family thioesterase [Geobacter sp.]